MQSETLAATAEHAVARLHLRVAWLCGLVLCFEGYDIAAVGYAVPSLVDAWRVPSSGFTQALTIGQVGCCLGRSGPGYWAIGWVGNPCCGFRHLSLLSALASSPLELAALRLLILLRH
jgi:MFS transporter, AAHS family, 4-hydroxybenzoate transporter